MPARLSLVNRRLHRPRQTPASGEQNAFVVGGLKHRCVVAGTRRADHIPQLLTVCRLRAMAI